MKFNTLKKKEIIQFFLSNIEILDSQNSIIKF